MLLEQWRHGRDEAEEKRRGERLTCGGCNIGCATRGDRRRRWWFAVAGGAVLLLSLSPLFFSLLCFFFLFSASPLSFLFFLFSSLPSLLCSCFFFGPPIFIGKNKRGTWLGWTLCYHPKNYSRNTSPPSSRTRGKLRASGVNVFFKREIAVTGRQIFFFPYFACPGEEEDPQCLHNGTVLGFSFFFNEQCMKRCRFGKNGPFHLNENNAKLMLKYKSILNL